MTHVRCNTVKWLSRRSIGQLIVVFASPTLPLILLMSTMGCRSRGEADVGVACALVETGLMLCGATIGVLLAFEIHRERKRGDGERDGQSSESGPPIPKGSSETTSEDKKRSSVVDRNSKNKASVKAVKVAARVLIPIILIVMVVAAALDTEEWDAQHSRTFYSPDSDTLFLSSATILAFALFGSALTRSGQNKDLNKSIVVALIGITGIQMVFMMSLVLYFNVPKMIWGVMTAIALLIVLPVMVASRIQPNGKSSEALSKT